MMNNSSYNAIIQFLYLHHRFYTEQNMNNTLTYYKKE